MRHDSPACSSRSMIVGIHRTGDGRYGPDPSGAGTHAGTHCHEELTPSRHLASRKLSHPHPGPFGFPGEGTGVSPSNPSSPAAASSMCAPQLGTRFIWNVWSETANALARA